MGLDAMGGKWARQKPAESDTDHRLRQRRGARMKLLEESPDAIELSPRGCAGITADTLLV
jgi:hypothetical protein